MEKPEQGLSNKYAYSGIQQVYVRTNDTYIYIYILHYRRIRSTIDVKSGELSVVSSSSLYYLLYTNCHRHQTETALQKKQ